MDMCGKEVTVNFAPVNPSKTIVLLQSSHGAFDKHAIYVVQASLAALDAASMQLNLSIFSSSPSISNKSIYASWQVIEFY